MSRDPGQRRVETADASRRPAAFGRRTMTTWTPSRARRLDLGVGRGAAAVLGDERLDPLVAHQLKFVGERERAAREDRACSRGRASISGRPVDRAHDIAVLRRAREGGELQPPLGQKHAFAASARAPSTAASMSRDFDPAVAVAARPGRAGEDDERHAGRRGRRRSALADMRAANGWVASTTASMPFGLEIGCKPLRAAEAADPLRDRRGRRIRGRARRATGSARRRARRPGGGQARSPRTFRRE